MRLTSLVLAAAVAVIAATPAFAAGANPAASLALVNDSDGGGTSSGHKGGHTGTLVLVGLGIAAVVGGAVALGTGHHHDNTPASN